MTLIIGFKCSDGVLLHHLSKQGRGFEGTEPLTAKRLPEGVRFYHHLSQRFLPARTAGSNGVVPFPKRREEIRPRLQGQHDPLPQRKRKAEPEPKDQNGEGPLHFGRVIATPQHDHRDQYRGSAGAKRHEQDPQIVMDAMPIG